MIFGSSIPTSPIRRSLSALSQERAEHNKLRVLPVPVGDSRRALSPLLHDSITFFMYSFWQSYGLNGKYTSHPLSCSLCYFSKKAGGFILISSWIAFHSSPGFSLTPCFPYFANFEFPIPLKSGILRFWMIAPKFDSPIRSSSLSY